MQFSDFKNAVIARCKALGIEKYELYYQTAESTTVGIFQHAVNQFTGSADGGVCLRCIVGGHMGYASTQELSAEAALALVDTAVDNAAVLETDDPVFLGAGGQAYAALDRAQYPLPTTEALIATALAAQKAVYETDQRVVDGTSTQAISEREQIAICNSQGLDLSYVNNVAGIVSIAVVSDGASMGNAVEVRLGELDRIDLTALARKVSGEAVKKLGGDLGPTGNFPVVFSPEAMADLLETYSVIFSAERARKGLSKLAGQEGQAIAAPCVTVVDDPFHPQSPAPIHFDAEGSPTRRKDVVERGVLKTLLYDLKNAALAGTQTTGNAAKAGYQAPVGIRPFSMSIASGEHTPDEILQMAGDGVYVQSVTGLHAGTDPVSGDFSVESAGYYIEGGKRTGRIRACTVAGNFYDLLKDITAVANDSHLPMALGMTAFGAPTTLVSSLSVAGK